MKTTQIKGTPSPVNGWTGNGLRAKKRKWKVTVSSEEGKEW